MAGDAERWERYRRKMLPDVLEGVHVASVNAWPLKASHIRQERFWGACDIVVHFVDTVKTGNKWNCRRVWWDGDFYVAFRGRRLRFGADVWDDVLGAFGCVYGPLSSSGHYTDLDDADDMALTSLEGVLKKKRVRVRKRVRRVLT